MEKLTVKEFSKHIRSKAEFYEALLRNGHYLPALKSTMINEAYLIKVMEGSAFCLKVEEIRLRSCPHPPSKDILLTKLMEAIKAKGITQPHCITS